MKRLLLGLMLSVFTLAAMAQRQNMDRLDRGLVAIKVSSGVYCSWRINADEYYDVKYNLYRDGAKIAENLNVSNYTDAAGTASSKYTVKAVVRGVEKEASKEVAVMGTYYKEIVPKHDASLKSTYVPNDACCADVDGDGELEILLKYDNNSEISQSYPKNGPKIDNVDTQEYSLFECLKQDGTVLWWVNCGPNMGDFQNNEQNIVAYDWDGDGKAEAIFRAADGTTIHMADGSVYTVGDASLNYRAATGGGTNWFMHSGKEYLLYVNGATGKPYVDMEYPLKRLEDSENPNGLLSGGTYDGLVNTAWGDGYGHRSSKHFFGAPYLDGKKPSIFIGRGIYTRHKFIAYDVDPDTHQLVERWRWFNNSNGPWKGQGYHNYAIVDVDWDGRDEIVWGSMVIDDNGMGLSTTGLGHGDAQHHGDLNPYVHGQEGFFCNEDEPANNYRDLTTSKIYYRLLGSDDAGRSMAGNFSNDFPGAIGYGAHDTPISTVTNDHVSGMGSTGLTQNFRIYWDGDLLEECADGIRIYKYGSSSPIATHEGAQSNNSTKATPCYQGDLYGDWREEVIMRTSSNNIRIYSTTIPTEYRNYSLWYDHQYRNAMVWQMCGYNQPPHVSYFLGELEGITVAPPVLTTQGREVIADGATIGASLNDKHVMLDATSDATINVADGAAPYIFTDNAPSWVQGTAPSECTTKNTEINYDYYTHTVTGGAFTGTMRLVKQGDGELILPNVTQTYTGETSIWAGSLSFDGEMQNSKVWMNRFTKLNTVGGKFPKGLSLDYEAELNIGTSETVSTVTVGDLRLGFGSIVNIDLIGGNSDKIVASKIIIEKKDWTNGPKYLAPIIRVNGTTSGKYVIAEVGSIEGNIADLIIESGDAKCQLSVEDGKIMLDVVGMREGQDVTWVGNESGVWDLNSTLNFSNGTEASDFVTGDRVVFDDNALTTDVTIAQAVSPASVVFKNETKDYVISGDGIGGAASLTKEGAATVTINNTNSYTGGTFINGGKVVVSSLANNTGTDFGALGSVKDAVTIKNGATLAVSKTMLTDQPIRVGSGADGYLEVPSGMTLTANNIWGDMAKVYKTGTGTLNGGEKFSASRLYINEGTVNIAENSSSIMQCPSTVVFNGTNVTLSDVNNTYSYSTSNVNYEVPEGKSGKLYLDGRCNYKGKLTGKGSFTVYGRFSRNYLQGNWSAFEGTLNPQVSGTDAGFLWENGNGLPKATVNIASGVNFYANTYNVEIGDLKGAGTIQTSGTITVGGLNKDVNFTGSFLSDPAVVKKGTGKWNLTKPITGIRSLTVNGGTFILAPSAGGRGVPDYTNVVLIEKPFIVAQAGTLTGCGHISALTVNNGGVAKIGKNASSRVGAIYAHGNVQTNSGSELSFFIANSGNTASSRSWLDITGTLTVSSGKISAELASNYSPKEGDAIILWKATGNVNITNAQFDLPVLPEGLGWDTSTMASDGTLRVVASTGIHNVKLADDAIVVAEVYALSGAKVATVKGSKKSVANLLKQQNISSGVYVLRMSNGVNVETQRFSVK